MKYKGKFCGLYTAEIQLFEIQRQTLTVTPEIHLFEFKVILPSLITKLNFLNKKKMCSMNYGWLKETFWQYVTIHGLGNCNAMFQNWRESFIRIKLILKFDKDCNFAGQFLKHLFFLLIFLLPLSVNLRIALHQQGLIDSYRL